MPQTILINVVFFCKHLDMQWSQILILLCITWPEWRLCPIHLKLWSMLKLYQTHTKFNRYTFYNNLVLWVNLCLCICMNTTQTPIFYVNLFWCVPWCYLFCIWNMEIDLGLACHCSCLRASVWVKGQRHCHEYSLITWFDYEYSELNSYDWFNLASWR